MVRQGNFTVELVEAESRVPFKEHTAPNGENYVEVEPDVEYFVRLKSHLDKNETASCFIYIDGENIGYAVDLTGNDQSDDYGLWSFVDGISAHKALKFTKTPVFHNGHAPRSWTGKVQMKWYEAIPDGYINRGDVATSWKAGDVGSVHGDSNRHHSKGVKTSEGTVSTSKNESRRYKSYRDGNLLETITLNYCTAVGLIEAGILPRPPLWDYHRMKCPYQPTKDSSSTRIKVVTPQTFRVEGHGNLVQAKEYDLFDLSTMSFSDDEN